MIYKRIILLVFIVFLVAGMSSGQEESGVVLQDEAVEESMTLDEVVEIVLLNSPELHMAEEDIKKAEREYKTAKTYYFPHLTLQGSVGVDFLHVEEFDDNNMGVNLILDWDFFRNGMLIYRVAQARATMEEAILKRYDLELKVAMEAKQSIFDLVVQSDQLAVEILELDREREKLNKLTIQYEQGEIRKTDIARFKANLFEREQRYLKKNQEYSFAVERFKRKAKLEELKEVDYTSLELVSLSNLSVTECEEIALDNVPQNKINKMAYDLAKKGAKLARWKRWPQVELFAGNAFALDDLGQESNQFELRTGVIVKYPLYDGGEIKNQILLAELQEERAKLAYDQGIEDIRDKVKEAYMNVEGYSALVEAAAMQVEILTKDKKLSEMEYKDGNVSKFDYEETIIGLKKAQLRKKSAYFDFLKAYVNLENTLGKRKLTFETIDNDDSEEQR